MLGITASSRMRSGDALDDTERRRARCGDQHGEAGLFERVGQEAERFG